jgi:hypothetical protein
MDRRASAWGEILMSRFAAAVIALALGAPGAAHATKDPLLKPIYAFTTYAPDADGNCRSGATMRRHVRRRVS